MINLIPVPPHISHSHGNSVPINSPTGFVICIMVAIILLPMVLLMIKDLREDYSDLFLWGIVLPFFFLFGIAVVGIISNIINII